MFPPFLSTLCTRSNAKRYRKTAGRNDGWNRPALQNRRNTALTTILRLSRATGLLSALAFALGVAACAYADEEKKAEKAPLDVKATFRTICSYCHQDMGRKPGKAPQLMDSQRDDAFIFNRIKNGKPGLMAAFGSTFSDDDIRRIIKFIRSLKPNEEPQNPS